MQSASGVNAGVFWPVVATVTFLDVMTKALAVRLPHRVPHEVIGDTVRFTLVYNPGAAFGIHVGAYSRWVFMTLTVVALAILAWLYQSTREGQRARVAALALVCGGAIGNLIDRLRSDMGVVDFIDIGFGDSRWPTFNIADMAVSAGAFLLAWVLWDDDRSRHDRRRLLRDAPDRRAAFEAASVGPPAVAPLQPPTSAKASAMPREPEPGEAS